MRRQMVTTMYNNTTYSVNSQSGNKFTIMYLQSGFSLLCTSPFESCRLYHPFVVDTYVF